MHRPSYGIYLIGWFFIGLFLAFPIGSALNHSEPGAVVAFRAILLGILAAEAVGTLVYFMRLQAIKSNERAAAERQRIEQQELERTRASAAAQTRLDEIAMLAIGAVATFETLPGYLTEADHHRDQARRHFQAGAFSPFWDSIEAAYASLGDYQNGLRTISQSGLRHADAVTAFHRAHDSRYRFDPFPVTLAAAKATAAGESLAEALHADVYRAQQSPVFAQIWEQRRTTAAVVAGFSSLRDAVSGMQRSIESRVIELTDAVTKGNQSVLSGISSALESNSAQVSQAIRSQTAALESRVDKVVWYLKERHASDMGLRPW